MAGVTLSGFREHRAAVKALPKAVEEAVRKVARDTALRVMHRAQQLVAVDTGVTRDSISVKPEPDRQLYAVGVFENKPHIRAGHRTATMPNIDIWLEFGTIHMHARPFLRPALDAENDRYVRDMKQAAEDVLSTVL